MSSFRWWSWMTCLLTCASSQESCLDTTIKIVQYRRQITWKGWRTNVLITPTTINKCESFSSVLRSIYWSISWEKMKIKTKHPIQRNKTHKYVYANANDIKPDWSERNQRPITVYVCFVSNEIKIQAYMHTRRLTRTKGAGFQFNYTLIWWFASEFRISRITPGTETHNIE